MKKSPPILHNIVGLNFSLVRFFYWLHDCTESMYVGRFRASASFELYMECLEDSLGTFGNTFENQKFWKKLQFVSRFGKAWNLHIAANSE